MDGKSASEIIKIMEEKDNLAKENPFVKMEKAMDEKREENASEKVEEIAEDIKTEETSTEDNDKQE